MSEQKQDHNSSSDSDNCSETTKKIKAESDLNGKVDFDKSGISYHQIETESVCSCHFILISDLINNQQFAYLSHSAREYEKEDLDEVLIDVIRIIVKNIHLINKKRKKQHLNLSQATNLKILLGGGVDDNINLIRQGLILLNDATVNLDEKFVDSECKLLYQKLRNKLRIIKPVTYFERTSDDEQSDDDDDDVGDEDDRTVKH